jgi:hypothetical protein
MLVARSAGKYSLLTSLHEGFHQTGHSSLLGTILAVNAQAPRLCDQVTALSAPRVV